MSAATIPALRTTVLLLATLCAGLMAGLFALYAHTIMPGLANTEDQTFVGAFQEIDRAIEATPYVAATFFGGAFLTGAAIGLDRQRPRVWWTSAALILTVTAIAITAFVNVPLNHGIQAAGDPNAIDVTQVRQDFREGWWRLWNLVRVATSLAAFACLSWALTIPHTEEGR